MTHLEQQFADLWLFLYPTIDLHSEYRFSPPRRYRWDFCHPESKVAIEIQGGVWMGKSGHSGGTGVLKDYEKLCLAASQGWRVFLLADSMITVEYLGSIARAIEPPELTAIENLDELAVNYQPKHRARQKDYIGCISPKQIKGITYHYWVYYERGKRCYRCLGNDRASAVAKAKAIYDPRSASRSMVVN
jgi:hypothetical protein